MKFRIGDCVTEDSMEIEADTVEEIQEIAVREVNRRGWQEPWSEKLED